MKGPAMVTRGMLALGARQLELLYGLARPDEGLIESEGGLAAEVIFSTAS